MSGPMPVRMDEVKGDYANPPTPKHEDIVRPRSGFYKIIPALFSCSYDAGTKGSLLALIGFVVNEVLPPLSATLFGYGAGAFVGKLVINLTEKYFNETSNTEKCEKIKNLKIAVQDFKKKHPYYNAIFFVFDLAIAFYVSALLAFGLAFVNSAILLGLGVDGDLTASKQELRRQKSQEQLEV